MKTKYNDGRYIPIPELKEIVFSSLKGLTQESRIKYHFPLNYEELMSWDFPKDFSFIQKLYHYLNGDNNLILIGRCKTCGEKTSFKTITSGYSQYCCTKCQQNNCENKQKCKNTWDNKSEEEINKWKKNISEAWTDDKKKAMVKKCRETNLEKYGVTSYTKTPEFVNKMKHTKYLHYGNENYCAVEKIRKTKLERYGDETYSNVEKCKETWNSKSKNEMNHIVDLRKHTCLERYGETSYTKTEECCIKTKQTKLERYGSENYNNSEKNKKTCLERYGETSYIKTPEGKKKVKEGIYKNTGHRTSWACSEPYVYDGISFDSSWEVAFYIYHKDHNENIKRSDLSYEYEFENKKMNYYPDFELNGDVIEIKGTHFFEGKDINKRMINPFGRSQDDLFEAKHQCMIRNNIKIITDCSEFISYVYKKYGNDYIKKFKKKK